MILNSFSLSFAQRMHQDLELCPRQNSGLR
jgi:hypothetical protein